MTPTPAPPVAPWNVERANRALPLVRRIVEDLVRAHAEWTELVERFTLATAGSRSAASDDARELQRLVGQRAADVEGFVRELAQLGVECKSLDSGLVDFLSERDGRAVYLCWRLGEREVTHWHELEAGSAGRQPI